MSAATRPGRRVLSPALEELSREQLLALQEERLIAQVRRCYESVPFYRNRWPAEAGGCESLDDFRRLIPFIGKKDFVGADIIADERLASRRDRRVAEYHLTSGTSGLGQEIHPLTVFDLEAQASSWTYISYWNGLEPGDRVAYTFPVALQQGGLWSPKASEKMGFAGFQLGKYSSAEKLDHLLTFQPHGVVISPSYLTHLAALAKSRGVDPRADLPHLKAFFVAGENYHVEWVQDMEDFWGARVAEWYGLMQSGLNLAISCENGLVDGERRRGLHLMEQRVLCEVLHPRSDEAVAPGEEGELVITNLFREAFPVVRFRTNDRVRLLAEPCDCGRPFARIEAGTVARYDDMLKIRGQNVWPEAVDKVVLADERVAEYAGEVFLDDRGSEQVRLRVEMSRGVEADAEETASAMASLEERVKTVTGVRMAVSAIPAGSLDRFEFKVRRWTDQRKMSDNVVRHTRSD